MKLKQRLSSQPFDSMVIFVIPLLTYIMLKGSNSIAHNEFVWWIVIPLAIVVWFFRNFKIVRGKKV